uniref:2-dehydropantoate 2-reductase n=1 Tax=Pyramimonas obovata TaxID=1411642 RepID=A0A7S0WR07_9CHLO|mmetsp:Transcript_3581/g.7437  ORF Transcript_3581/g.7437 Transcript_3581/m.7437 type:complete len:327 (+) Transcript_3581:167-1147(+)|eukprot:CAMPEP_0118924598 /NCGR_PEP_ID=MMETSP1169-20130426/2661_1 /TAXON_ID=36882 /ORGANISM="Pyramimonas obovata, Strain CCMP722" /LENGTH=326 /DNA_ID=CAMNT_0006865725 /DNA_START=48 /DNA_END=1028 /DNA_ORIENTATION=-
MSEPYRVCIYGAGGVGGYLAARLAQNGVDVTVVARGEHLKTIQDSGLKLTSISGDFVASVKATEDPSEIGIVDLVIVASKSWQVEAIAPSIQPLLGRETIVVPTQNGIEAPERLGAVLGEEHVLGGYIRIQALVQGPGHILHDGLDVAEFGTGLLPGSGSFCKRQLERMAQAFQGAIGLCLKVQEDVWMKMWRKILAICAYSGVCTASRGNIGDVVECDASATLFQECLLETHRVALASGVKLSEDEVEVVWKEFKGLAAASPTNTPSLMRDMLAGRPSELDDQLGAVVRAAGRARVEVPRVAALYAALMVQEQRNRRAAAAVPVR